MVTAEFDPLRTLSLRGRTGSSCPTPALRDTRPDRLNWVDSGLTHRSKALFDYFVGASEQQGRELQAELPCTYLVHDKLKFRRELDRQFGRIGTT
jgi:hypothetical protein